MSRVEQTCGVYDPALPLPPHYRGVAVGGLGEPSPVLIQEDCLWLIERV